MTSQRRNRSTTTNVHLKNTTRLEFVLLVGVLAKLGGGSGRANALPPSCFFFFRRRCRDWSLAPKVFTGSTCMSRSHPKWPILVQLGVPTEDESQMPFLNSTRRGESPWILVITGCFFSFFLFPTRTVVARFDVLRVLFKGAKKHGHLLE